MRKKQHFDIAFVERVRQQMLYESKTGYRRVVVMNPEQAKIVQNFSMSPEEMNNAFGQARANLGM